MHSKVFEISMKAVTPEDRLEEFDIPDWFLEAVALFVDESDRSKDIKWLQDVLGEYSGFKLSDDGVIEIEDISEFQKSYFQKRMVELKETVGNLTIDEFSSETSLVVTRMKRLIEDKTDFYVYVHGQLMTMDQFIRELSQYGVNRFYIGGTVGYNT